MAIGKVFKGTAKNVVKTAAEKAAKTVAEKAGQKVGEIAVEKRSKQIQQLLRKRKPNGRRRNLQTFWKTECHRLHPPP